MKYSRELHRVTAGLISAAVIACTGAKCTVPVYAYTDVSKKGLQGDYMVTEEGVTGHHMLLNLYLDQLMSPVPTERSYVLHGCTWYFDPALLSAYETRLKQAAERGIDVTLVLLMRGNETCSAYGMMDAYDATDRTRLYALNPDSDAVAAAFYVIAHDLGSGPYGARHFVLGNEVNMPLQYNYTEDTSLEYSVDLYTRTFLRFSQVLRMEGSAEAKAYISLDHSWTTDGDGFGFSGKEYLDLFAERMEAWDPSCDWHLAYHLYAPDMTDTASIWERPELSGEDEDALYISPANLSVLTDYIRTNYGSEHRVILSEQGYDYRDGEDVQAQAMAMSYEAARDDDMVDAIIYRSYRDEGTDGLLDLGLLNPDGTYRQAFLVYQSMT